MTRIILEVVLFFVIPFVAFAGWLVASRQPVMSKESWEGAGGWLSIVGAAIVVASLVWLGFTAERRSGAYEPAHIENGVIVPGRTQ
ncbi:MAG: DUF6111 family protein [Beijerinckiaceae bacterium]